LRPELKPLEPLEVTRADAEVFGTLLRGRVERYLAEEDYPAEPGRQCYSCPFVLRCEKGQGFIEPFLHVDGEEINAALAVHPENAQDVYNAVQFLRATANRLSDILREHATERKEPLDLGQGMLYGPHRKVTNKYGPPVGKKISYATEAYDANEGDIPDELVDN
jgi:hypothetical protein